MILGIVIQWSWFCHFGRLGYSSNYGVAIMMKQKVLLISILTSLALMGCGSDHDDNQNTAKMLSTEQTLNFGDRDCWLGGTVKLTGL